MVKKRKQTSGHRRLQVVTLCISTAMVLVLLGLVVISVLTARNLTQLFKENLIVTMVLQDDMTQPEAEQLCGRLKQRPYVSSMEFISKEQALREQTKAMGTDPSEFADGNPFLASVELHMKADYANSDSLGWISKELKRYPKVSEITYPQDLVDNVNHTLSQVSLVLLVLALLLTFVSFALINNTVRLGIYARRFSIHTMKLVGAPWGFIRKPFVSQAVGIGVVAAILAIAILGAGMAALYQYQPDVVTVIDWRVLTVTALAVLLCGVAITALCAYVSVSGYLKMKAGELYKI